MLPRTSIVYLAMGIFGMVGFAGEHNTLTPAELADGWVLLFDGESLFGWQAAGKANWRVADGTLVADGGEPGLLCTTSQFGDFILRVECRLVAGGNSGIFLRTVPQPPAGKGPFYEVNLSAEANPAWPTGSIVFHKKSNLRDAGDDWQSFELWTNGGRLSVKRNGAVLLEYEDPRPVLRGHVGLQFRQGKVEFRGIKLRPLGVKSLFNGKDLSGWEQPAGSKSEVAITPEGWLRLKGGWGTIETAGRYGEFTLQLEAFVNGRGLNSGVFFRSIPGELMNGYECQIHNGFKNGDRTQPQDGGTGGIFRRQPARKVLSDDFTWFHLTIHADGPHFATWVNGYPVADWTDQRPADPNPRRGRRLEPGTIQLQGHDPGTDLLFRNLRIVELPPPTTEADDRGGLRPTSSPEKE
jgi:hypothetical protein